MFPSVGRIVHFIDAFAAHRAAIITHVRGNNDGTVCLNVFGLDEDYRKYWIPQGDTVGTWHWPEREG